MGNHVLENKVCAWIILHFLHFQIACQNWVTGALNRKKCHLPQKKWPRIRMWIGTSLCLKKKWNGIIPAASIWTALCPDYKWSSSLPRSAGSLSMYFYLTEARKTNYMLVITFCAKQDLSIICSWQAEMVWREIWALQPSTNRKKKYSTQKVYIKEGYCQSTIW